jgi:hypothetical protein
MGGGEGHDGSAEGVPGVTVRPRGCQSGAATVAN